jgi:hypothetical protein
VDDTKPVVVGIGFENGDYPLANVDQEER